MPTTFSQWWSSLTRHPIVMVTSFCAVIALTVCVILYSPRKYRSTSQLLLRSGHESATLDPTANVTGDMIAPIHTREDEVETAISVMRSRAIMDEVVDALGADAILDGKLAETDGDEPSEDDSVDEADINPLERLKGTISSAIAGIDPISKREAAIRAIERDFGISAPTKSSVVSVEYRAKDPFLAQELVRIWVDSYLQHHAKVHRTQGTYAFFREQDVDLRRQLDEANREVRAAKSRGGFATLEGQQKLLEAQLESVRTELLQVDAELVATEARVESFTEMLNSKVNQTMTEELSGIASEAHEEMRGLLFELEVLENEYASKLKSSHPKLVAIRDQLANATKIVDAQQTERKQFRQTANPTHQKILENQVVDIAAQQALRSKKETLQKQHARLLEEITGLNEHEEHLAELTRDLEVLNERHKVHSVLLEQARLNEVLEENQITSINVVQPASLEQRPISPNKALCAMMGMFAALAISICLPVLLDIRSIQHANRIRPVDSSSGRESSRNDVSSLPAMSEVETPKFTGDGDVSGQDRYRSDVELETASRPR